MNIVFISRTLNLGGAERQLVNLAIGLKRRKNTVSVITLYPEGKLVKELNKESVSVYSINKKNRWDIFGFFYRLLQCIRDIQPDIIHSYGTSPNIISIALKLFFRPSKYIWGIRSAYMDLAKYGYTAQWVYRLECKLSKYADLIIANSIAGKTYAVSNGFPENKIMVISNGIDINLFKPNSQSRKERRLEWGVDDKSLVVGIVGRLDIMKDYPIFIKSMHYVLSVMQDVKAICIGSGNPEYTRKLLKLSTKYHIENNLVWLYERSDIHECMNGFDVLVSSSYGEGFPNVIGEAMACGIPCVVTDVGDSAFLVDKCGIVVEPRNPKMLANAIIQILSSSNKKKHNLSKCAENRIVNLFSIEKLIDSTEVKLKNIL